MSTEPVFNLAEALARVDEDADLFRSEEHTSELQSH